MKKRVEDEWAKVLASIKAQLQATVLTTSGLLEDQWTQMIECAENADCCDSTEVTYNNLLKTYNSARTKIVSRYTDWAEIEDQIWKYAEECPELVESCDILGACWDGSDRKNDEKCSCPDFVYPACPLTQCDGEPSLEDCSCPAPVIVAEPEPIFQTVPKDSYLDSHDANAFSLFDWPATWDLENPMVNICSFKNYCGWKFELKDGTHNDDNSKMSEVDDAVCFDLANNDVAKI